MKLPWDIILNNLQKGVIIRDGDFRFPDQPDEPSPKWLLILSTDPKNLDDTIVFCLTTSKAKTYRGKFSEKVIIEDDNAPEGAFVVEYTRITKMKLSTLKHKYDNDKIEIKNKIDSLDLQNIFDAICDSPTIPDYIKEWLHLFD